MNNTTNNAPPTPPMPAPVGPSTGGPSMLTPLDPVRVLRRYKALFVAAAILGVILGVCVTFAWKRYAPRYEAFTRLEARGRAAGPESLDTEGNISEDALERYMRTQVNYIRADKTLRAAVQLPEVKGTPWYERIERRAKRAGRHAIDEAIEELNDVLEVGTIARSKLIEVRVSTRHAADAPIVVTAVSQAYLDDMELLNSVSGNDLERVFQRRRDKAESQAQTLETQMQTLLDKEGLASVDRQRNADQILFDEQVRIVQEIQQQLEAARRALAGLEQAMADGSMERSATDLATAETHPSIAPRMRLIDSLEHDKLNLMSRGFGRDHKIIKEYNDRIASARDLLQIETDRVLAQMDEMKLNQARGMVVELEALWAEAQVNLKALWAKVHDLTMLLNEYDDLRDRLQAERAEIVRIDELLDEHRSMRQRPDALRVHLANKAVTPNKPAFPRYQTMVPAITFLVLFGVGGAVFARELLDQRIKSPSDVRYLPSAELLGVVPDAAEDPSGVHSVSLVVTHFPDSLVAESVRQVRVETIKRLEADNLRSLVIVGAQHESGVTSLAVNLAASAALSGRTVVLVDANLRRPALHEIFEAPREPGMGELLGKRADLDDALRTTEYDGLSLITAGQVEYGAFDQLESPALRQVIEDLEQRFDLVVIDSPPAALLADPRLIADRVDASLLVVRASREKRGLTQRVIRQLTGVRSRMIGLVLNGVKTQAGGYFRRSYRDFYKYHGSNVNREKAGAA